MEVTGLNDPRNDKGTDLEDVLKYLQTARVRLLRELRSGRDRQAAEIGRRAISESGPKVSTGIPGRDRLVVPSRELASIITVDVQVADAIHSSDARSAIAGITRTYELAGTSPTSLKLHIARQLIALRDSQLRT